VARATVAVSKGTILVYVKKNANLNQNGQHTR